jgi:DNA repair exonuclease SbcCD nuclease subunit
MNKENFFKKIACFTDLHIGAKSNSQLHLNDCEEFVDWFIETAKQNNCETGICLGDWHNNRNTINLVTLSSSIKCLEKLGKAFDQFFWFPGNHDLFYKDRRDVHSSIFGRHIPGVTVIDTIFTEKNVTLVPWLVGDEWKKMSKIKSKYVFGHFELPLFYMNAMVQMPETGELSAENFVHQDYVFSGHFHKRQNKGKVWYIGNAFPHNYSDAWDDERGMMMLEWGGTPEFCSWDDAPKFRTIKLSQLLEKPEEIIKNKMYLKVSLDIDISFEEANFIKETFIKNYNIREISLIHDNSTMDISSDDQEYTKFESVDQIVSEELLKIEQSTFSSQKLLDIYKNL